MFKTQTALSGPVLKKKGIGLLLLLGTVAIAAGALLLRPRGNWCGYYTDSGGKMVEFDGLTYDEAIALVTPNFPNGPAGWDDTGNCGPPA